MELWKAVIGMGELAESQALDTIVNGSGQGMRECWRQRLQAMRADLGYAEASALERLLIQQVTLCWLNRNLTEYRFTNVTKQSISFACGMYWEKRVECCAATLHSSLRDISSSKKTITQHASFAGQYGNRWRAASEPYEVSPCRR